MIDDRQCVDGEEEDEAAVLRVEAIDEEVVQGNQHHQDVLEPEGIELRPRLVPGQVPAKESEVSGSTHGQQDQIYAVILEDGNVPLPVGVEIEPEETVVGA